MKDPADDICHVSQSVADWRFADRVRNGPVPFPLNTTLPEPATRRYHVKFIEHRRRSASATCAFGSHRSLERTSEHFRAIKREYKLQSSPYFLRAPAGPARGTAKSCGSRRFDARASASNGYSLVSRTLSNANKTH